MKKFTFTWKVLPSLTLLLFFATVVSQTASAQTASISVTGPGTITNPMLIKAGGTVNFTATRSGTYANSSPSSNQYTFTWSGAGASFTSNPTSGNNITSANTVATFASVGSYSVAVDVRRGGAGNGGGTSNNPTPTPYPVQVFTVNAGNDQNINATTASLTGTAAGPVALTYAWTRVSGPNTPTITNGTTLMPSLSGLVPGSYTYRLTVNGSANLTDDIVLNVVPAPVGCNGQFFISHGTSDGSTSTTDLEKLTFSGATISAASFPINPTGVGFNAIGLNPKDGYMYGLRYSASGASVRLVRIGSGTPNNVVDLGEITATGLSDGDNAYAGCFDSDGTYYFMTDNDEFFKISGILYPSAVLTATKIADVTPNDFFVDIAIDPTDGQMYGVSLAQTLYKVNKTTGALTTMGTHAGSDYIAALFFDEIGNFYGYRQDGTFQKIDKTNAGLLQVGTAPSYTYADGCSCSFGRVFHNIDAPDVCPTVPNPNPVFNITVSIVNQTSSQKTGLTYTLDIPGNRFSFNQAAATIKTALVGANIMDNAGSVTISSTSGTNNKIVITQVKTGGVNATVSFTLQLKLVTLGGIYIPVPLQSEISGLPVEIGLTDLSNDPLTIAPDDPSLVDFCSGITLPVRLLSFSGNYRNDNTTLLTWEVENQQSFSHYQIERSANGADYTNVGSKTALMTSARINYDFVDDLSKADAVGNVFYYRLKMVDIDGRYTYSNVVMIRRDQEPVKGIQLTPNPVSLSAAATIRVSSEKHVMALVRVYDMSGKIVLQQQSQLTQGVNSISISNIARLQPGMYVVQVMSGELIQNGKLIVTR